ncbi:hypothetical protein [Actinoplanes sp. DH11]|uniref:hypothetical protein n=1 Tax=Actinoplanes sp. DH11 TaxID=2857011 RepID=UPI001E3AB727|nr:hypothetical protein [Actinoplanes sp. DH11]
MARQRDSGDPPPTASQNTASTGENPAHQPARSPHPPARGSVPPPATAPRTTTPPPGPYPPAQAAPTGPAPAPAPHTAGPFATAQPHLADPFATAQALSTGQAGSTAATAPPVTGTPLARPPGPHHPGRPPGDPPSPSAPDRTGPSGRTSRLRIGWHTVPRAALRGVALVPPTGAGLLLGRDQQQVPVPLRIFSPGSHRIVLVGGVRAAQLLIFRAFSIGARALVVTTEQRAWAGFGERATGQHNRLTVLGGEPTSLPPGTAQTPSLIVHDLGVTGPATAPPLGPWSTQLTVLRQLDRPGVAALQEAELTLLQRLGGDEATLAAATLRLDQQNGQLLPFMTDDMMALIGDGPARFVFLNQTGIELQYVGPPMR